MRPYVGQDWVKQGRTWNKRTRTLSSSRRLAQCSAVDSEYAYMYWPDTDSQTRVRVQRFGRTTEWLPA